MDVDELMDMLKSTNEKDAIKTMNQMEKDETESGNKPDPKPKPTPEPEPAPAPSVVEKPKDPPADEKPDSSPKPAVAPKLSKAQVSSKAAQMDESDSEDEPIVPAKHVHKKHKKHKRVVAEPELDSSSSEEEEEETPIPKKRLRKSKCKFVDNEAMGPDSEDDEEDEDEDDDMKSFVAGDESEDETSDEDSDVPVGEVSSVGEDSDAEVEDEEDEEAEEPRRKKQKKLSFKEPESRTKSEATGRSKLWTSAEAIDEELQQETKRHEARLRDAEKHKAKPVQSNTLLAHIKHGSAAKATPAPKLKPKPKPKTKSRNSLRSLGPPLENLRDMQTDQREALVQAMSERLGNFLYKRISASWDKIQKGERNETDAWLKELPQHTKHGVAWLDTRRVHRSVRASVHGITGCAELESAVVEHGGKAVMMTSSYPEKDDEWDVLAGFDNTQATAFRNRLRLEHFEYYKGKLPAKASKSSKVATEDDLIKRFNLITVQFKDGRSRQLVVRPYRAVVVMNARILFGFALNNAYRLAAKKHGDRNKKLVSLIDPKALMNTYGLTGVIKAQGGKCVPYMPIQQCKFPKPQTPPRPISAPSPQKAASPPPVKSKPKSKPKPKAAIPPATASPPGTTGKRKRESQKETPTFLDTMLDNLQSPSRPVPTLENKTGTDWGMMETTVVTALRQYLQQSLPAEKESTKVPQVLKTVNKIAAFVNMLKKATSSPDLLNTPKLAKLLDAMKGKPPSVRVSLIVLTCVKEPQVFLHRCVFEFHKRAIEAAEAARANAHESSSDDEDVLGF